MNSVVAMQHFPPAYWPTRANAFDDVLSGYHFGASMLLTAGPCTKKQGTHGGGVPREAVEKMMPRNVSPDSAAVAIRCQGRTPRRRRTSAQATTTLAEAEVLGALARIIDPDFGEDIVSCGFVRDLVADPAAGRAAFRLQLTTPACPVKAEFERLVSAPSPQFPFHACVYFRCASIFSVVFSGRPGCMSVL